MPRAERAIEPKSPSVDDVFLSPRVVDETAFARFCEALRRSAADAAEAGERARAAAEAGRAAIPVAAKLRAQLEEAGRAAERVERQLAEARALAKQLQDTRDAAARFTAQADAIAEERISRLEAAMAPLSDAAEQRVNQLKIRLDRLVRPDLDRAGALQASVEQFIFDAESRLSAARAAAAEATGLAERRLEELSRALANAADADDQCRRLEAAAQRAEQAAASLAQAQTGGDAAQRAIADGLAATETTLERLAERQADLDRAVTSAVSLFQAAEKRNDERMERFEQAIQAPVAEAARLVGELDARARSLAGGAAIVERVEAALKRLEPWRGVLLGDGADGDTEIPPRLAEMLARAREELSGPLVELGQVIQTIARKNDTQPTVRSTKRPAAQAARTRRVS